MSQLKQVVMNFYYTSHFHVNKSADGSLRVAEMVEGEPGGEEGLKYPKN